MLSCLDRTGAQRQPTPAEEVMDLAGSSKHTDLMDRMVRCLTGELSLEDRAVSVILVVTTRDRQDVSGDELMP